MICIDGSGIASRWDATADVVVVGSGPAGAIFAHQLAQAGVDVLVVEEGAHVATAEYRPDSFGAMSQLYRDMGAAVSGGRAPLPIVQGSAVGGTSVINGAISWRLPRDVWGSWVAGDARLSDALPWDEVQAITEQIETYLGIVPTPVEVTGRNDQLMRVGADAVGLENRAIRRNVRGCEAKGRCLQGCPGGRKQSMDQTYLPDAVKAGARIASGSRVDHILSSGGSATGVSGRTTGGGTFRVSAPTVVIAASAVQSPLLLQRSGLRRGPVGRHFRAHPGFSMLGRFPDPVLAWEGSAQGHEVTGLRKEGLKFEALGLDPGMLASRMGLAGNALRRAIDVDLPHLASWAVALKARTEGRVRKPWFGPAVRYDLVEDDIRLARRGLRVLGEMMLAAGAEVVYPGVSGFDKEVRDPRRLTVLEREGPTDARAYTGVMTHLFGSCRMGSDPSRSVVDLQGRHHDLKNLWVVDSSIFPSNTGVNPQTSILAISGILAKHWIQSQ